MYNKAARQQLARQRKEEYDHIPRINKRINQMNDVASHDDMYFSKLTEFAKAHLLIWESVKREFTIRPDFRFGDTLLMFCDSVKHGRINLDS